VSLRADGTRRYFIPGPVTGDVRLVQVSIPAGKRETVLGALDDQGIDYVVTEETSGREYTAVVTFPLPAAAVEPVLEDLREQGIERDAYTIVVEAETVISKRFESLVERYEAAGDSDRIAREELQARAKDMIPTPTTFVVMTAVSVFIATAGLLLDSPAVVVGSMVIAPLIGPSMATNVGTVLADEDLFRRGAKLQIAGLALAILTATVFALAVRNLSLVPPGLDITAIGEIQERTAPDVLSLVVALGAGVAGALSLRSGVSASLVGVMIAVALVPPTAVIGIGVAWGKPVLVAGSSVLVLVNALSINLAALGTFWYSGYRPESWFGLDQARSALAKQVGTLVAVLLVLSVVLGGVTYNTAQTAAVEKDVRTDVERSLADTDATVVSLTVTQDRGLLTHPLQPEATRVVVTVGVRDGDVPPELADRIKAGLSTPGDPRVEVHVVRIQTARLAETRQDERARSAPLAIPSPRRPTAAGRPAATPASRPVLSP
jgi:uncharacterized hydrophobic protein (TIGR00341 family)